MTLTRQLWIFIAVLITLTFVSGFLVSSYSARNYYVEQLTVKNIDNAAGLALALSQMDKDPVTVELMISAQFDTGHYQRIRLEGPDGQTLHLRERPDLVPEAPTWFARLMAFDIPPGVAQVQDGWNQYGTLSIESESAYALGALWRVSYRLFVWYITIALVCGLIGSMVLRRISGPLQAVVEQAEAIGERRFITSKEPRTMEFRRVVRAMNTLTNRVRTMLDDEARRLDEIRRQSQLDPATGVANREQFLRLLEARLNLNDSSVRDGVLLIRVTGLAALNAKLGRAETDEWILALLARIQTRLEGRADCYSQCTLGRLNGSDFVILLQDTEFLADLAEEVWSAASELVQEKHLEQQYPLAEVGSACQPGEERSQLLSRLDDLLAGAEEASSQRLVLYESRPRPPLFPDADSWRHALEAALADNGISHACYPVITTRGELFHEEAMLRLRLGNEAVPAGAVIGWARRLKLLPQIDLQMLESVLQVLSEQPARRIAVNLSIDSLGNVASHLAIIERIKRYGGTVTQRLSLELNEQIAVQYAGPLASFSAAVKSHGVSVGLQSAGRNIAAVAGLEKLGLDYMKVDAALIQQQDGDIQSLLRGLCKLGHSLGLTMIAEGVLEKTDQSALAEMGFDGYTGPGV
ncbi:LapD/MoxY N-terminal periplasmic domain-containing protein [Wenzhouxiangella limi]|uniref:EAL domain-containing protein n=1 Tax=Wenzhouxiangella limi TaxID=2707351 RepID=A0A845UUH9_9GAMM|nr:LapD/MoxY N-terminal periplasmic domain-containing protein [Wenzhouxiangella limi]NDY95483.1 EAL domain-containing protein [Wenzhouxiangella limi]